MEYAEKHMLIKLTKHMGRDQELTLYIKIATT